MNFYSNKKKAKTTSWAFGDGVFLIVCSKDKKILDEEYNDILQAYDRFLLHIKCIIISSKGGMPNALQRERATNFWKEAKVDQPPMVVMSESDLVRYAVTAINFFVSKKLIVFAFNDFKSVFEYLKIDNLKEREDIYSEIEKLHSQIS